MTSIKETIISNSRYFKYMCIFLMWAASVVSLADSGNKFLALTLLVFGVLYLISIYSEVSQ